MEFEFHPWTELFPLVDADKLVALGKNIRNDGLVEPIVLYEGKILDGRNRYRACSLTGVEPTFIKFRELYTGEDPLVWMVRKNIGERNLGKGQLAAVGLDFLNLRHKPPFSEKVLREVAEIVGAGWSSIERLVAINKKDASIIDSVRAGTTSVAAASRDAGFQEYDSPIPGSSEYFGRGDKFREASEPLLRYLKNWRGRDFEFRHVNPKEATARVRKIEELLDGLEAAKADLASRAVKSQLTH